MALAQPIADRGVTVGRGGDVGLARECVSLPPCLQGHEDHSQEDPPFPFYFTEQKVVVGQAWQLGVRRLDYETARYYNFLIRLKVRP